MLRQQVAASRVGCATVTGMGQPLLALTRCTRPSCPPAAGTVSRIRLLGDTQHSSKIAFVEFVTADSARNALKLSGALLGAWPASEAAQARGRLQPYTAAAARPSPGQTLCPPCPQAAEPALHPALPAPMRPQARCHCVSAPPRHQCVWIRGAATTFSSHGCLPCRPCPPPSTTTRSLTQHC